MGGIGELGKYNRSSIRIWERYQRKGDKKDTDKKREGEGNNIEFESKDV